MVALLKHGLDLLVYSNSLALRIGQCFIVGLPGEVIFAKEVSPIINQDLNHVSEVKLASPVEGCLPFGVNIVYK